ncbi:MAG: 2,3-bisphosphoglycerate-independent phosphoglycerate mutase [Patescibacteria group bacterium]
MTITGEVNIRRSKGPVVLLVWDGFGISKNNLGNAVLSADMPVFRKLVKDYSCSLLNADSESVGLPETQPGNSEAGHATIGAGRIVESDQLTIDKAILNHSFENNPALLQAAAHCIRKRSALHLMGLLTNSKSGHASPKHVDALIKFASSLRLPRVALHLFTDGRDTPPHHSAHLLDELQEKLPPNFVIASLMGRFYAMDRNKFWERTELAYNAIANGEGVMAASAMQAITQAHDRGESDEFITPTVICKNKTCIAPVGNDDAIIFWNLRSDRARQLSKPFVIPDFEKNEPGAFRRHVIRKNLFMVTLTEFGKDLDSIAPAFPHHETIGTLVEALRLKKQLYIAESEKFSQVTYFLNGGYDRPRYGEDRIKIPSLRVASYDQKPRMSADRLARRLVSSLDEEYEFIMANFANADMVGHTGNFDAAVKACEALDDALGLIWKKVRNMKGTLIVTADHGNVECMHNPHGGVDTEHNMNPVPFLAAGAAVKNRRIRNGGLSDIAPTVLWLLGIPDPKEMTGKSLVR